MKKAIAVILSILTVFSACSIAVYAADPEETTVAVETDEPTTRNIKTDDGKLVVPVNFTQLKSSFLFKLIEKIILFILNLFGNADETDEAIATGIEGILDDVSERISQVSEDLSKAQ